MTDVQYHYIFFRYSTKIHIRTSQGWFGGHFIVWRWWRTLFCHCQV